MKIGLLIIATNKYTDFLYPLIESANKYFLNNHDVTYFVFTNQDLDIKSSDIVVTKIEHKEWPWMTLGRYGIFHNNKDIFNDMDYLYYCDADMLFVGDVGDEILSDRVGTTHPGYYNKEMKEIENNKNSSAYTRRDELKTYFAGGFNGGSKDQYLRMANVLSNNILDDYRKGIIAIWYDESHTNKYFINNPPSKVLDPGYCYPEGISIPFEKRLLALNKDHKSMQI